MRLTEAWRIAYRRRRSAGQGLRFDAGREIVCCRRFGETQSDIPEGTTNSKQMWPGHRPEEKETKKKR